MSHGVNILLLAAGIGAWRADPIADRTEVADAADPLPQAFVLTAIVISMAATAVMLAMAALGRDDDTTSAEDIERAQREFRSLETRGRAAHHIDEQSPQARRRRLREEEY
jgi:multicomponent Na+:H+ antiporter subunit C